jgi:tetratricopeptide (TPR) repeat protein
VSKLEYKPNHYFLGLLMKAGFTRRQAQEIFNVLFSHICETLLSGKAAQIKGFGTFQIYSKDRKKVNNTLDNQKEKLVRFYPSNALKLLIEHIAQQIITDLPELVNEQLPETKLAQFNQPLPETKLTKDLALSPVGIGKASMEYGEDFPTIPDDELEQIALSLKNNLAKDELTLEQRQAEFDIHYNIGIAYKEMALYNLAIEDLEKAINLLENHLVSKLQKHGYIQCCEVLSLCYSATGDFDRAEKKLLKAMELAKPTETQYNALRYDLALIYEATDRIEQATEAFFDVYAIDINFRRVAQKLKTLQSRYIKRARDERKNQLIPVLVRGKTITGERFEEETLIVNVSRRGAALCISYEPQRNSFLELRFSDSQRVKVAKIVWCTPATNPTGGFQAGVVIYHDQPK